jgi:hypothetical protein
MAANSDRLAIVSMKPEGDLPRLTRAPAVERPRRSRDKGRSVVSAAWDCLTVH